MNLVGRLFGSSIGRKMLMAVTGVVLTGFVVGHLVGNLQIFSPPDHINGYGAFLHSLGPTLWVVRLGLMAAVVIHIWAATVLTMENHAARKEKYDVKHTIRATVASRTMRWTGAVVLAFIVYHLAQFTFGTASAATYKEALPGYTMTSDYRIAGLIATKAGAVVPDVYNMVVYGFTSPVVALFYIIAVGLLSYHLVHGADSMFQSLGVRSEKWAAWLHRIVVVFCLAYFLGNLAIPAAVQLGKLSPHPAAPASAHLTAR